MSTDLKNTIFSVNIFNTNTSQWERYTLKGLEPVPKAENLSVYELADFSSDFDKLYTTYIFTDTKTLNQWNNYRKAIGTPIRITRAYCSVKHNKDLASKYPGQVAKYSQHMAGKAFDMIPYYGNITLEQMYKIALSYWTFVEPDYSSHVHGDARDPGSPYYPIVQYGSQNVYVATCQDALYYNGYLTLTDIDGIFGDITKNAVIKFQKDHNLIPDGIVGSQTWSALLPNT